MYHESRHSAEVRRWDAQNPDSMLVVSEAVTTEARCNLWRLGDRAGALDSDLRSGLFTDCKLTFAQMSAMAEPLFRRYAPRCNVGTLDLLHIAAAKRFGCRWFLSFDINSGCRAVAQAEKLRVFPELTPDDRKWLARLR